ncbi:unnamed protein product [Scytosiphon promiscuus]
MHVQYVGAAPGPGCCAVPPEASCAVTGARVCSIISIIIHVGALLAGGGWLFFGFYQWIASITAFVMCGILLCVYGRCAYIAAGVVYLIAATFDALMCTVWIYWYNEYRDAVDSDDDYYNFDNDSDDYEAWGNVLLWFALPPLLGGITLALGAVFAFTAICFWEDAPTPIVSMAPVAQEFSGQRLAHCSCLLASFRPTRLSGRDLPLRRPTTITNNLRKRTSPSGLVAPPRRPTKTSLESRPCVVGS